jgi:subtilisin-like proprotein convertase family protein
MLGNSDGITHIIIRDPIMFRSAPKKRNRITKNHRFRRLRHEQLEDRRMLSVSYPDFVNATGLNLYGSASTDPGVLRIAPTTGGTGAAWAAAQQFVSVDFETTFDFRLDDGSGGPGGSDGFAFVIQNNSGDSVSGYGGSLLGYTFLPNSLAVEFDIYQNELDPWGNPMGDPSHSHVSVHTGGPGDNISWESFSLGSASTSGFTLDDGNQHTATIEYVSQVLSVYVDDLQNPLLSVPVNLADTLDLNAGQAWVGFTGSTGGEPTNHDILSWQFVSAADSQPVISVHDVSKLEGGDGTETIFSFVVERFGTSSGDVTANWTTVDGSAVGGTDFVASSGTITIPATSSQSTIDITVLGDIDIEGTEEFLVELSDATGALISDERGRGIIDFDDTESFTLVLMPDTQNYSTSYPGVFEAQSQWIVDNKNNENFAFVSHLGDVVNNPASQLEWERADIAMDLLDGNLANNPDGLIPYSVAAGNHDLGDPDDNYVQYFGESRYSGRSWYGGASADEKNHYQVFQAAGQDYLHIAIEYDPGHEAILWAQSVIDSHPGMPVVVTTHAYIHEDGLRPQGERVFNELIKPNPEIFMVLCGHFFWENQTTSLNYAGSEVIAILADYQARPHGGDGWLQFLEFFPELDTVDVTTYSPTLDRFEIDEDSQFSLALEFDQRFDFPVTYANNVPKSLADARNASRPGVTTSTVDVSSAGTVLDVNVALDISHTYDSQLSATLYAPDGTSLVLFDNVGVSGNNFNATNFDDSAATSITAAAAPFTGIFKPQGSLAVFNDLDAAGTWTLEIIDAAKGDSGTLNRWSVDIVTYEPELNNPPTALDDSGVTDEDLDVTVDVLANDSDADGDTLQMTSLTNPANGSVVDNGDGTVTYTPANNFNGTDSFTYRAFDGTDYSDPATVTITVTPVNDNPVAVDDSATTEQDTAVVIPVLANDTDVDLDDTLSVQSVGTATNGTVTIGGSDVTYTPDAGYFGADSFTYTVSDNNGGTDTATVNVNVTRVNNAPVADDDAYSTNEDTQLVVAAPGVLDGDSDAESDPLTAVLVSGPSNGTLTLNPDGSFTYDPDLNFNGTDSFTYKADDDIDQSNVATVTLTVNAINDAPIAVDDSATTDQDVAKTIDVLANDTDVDSVTLAVTDATNGANGTVAVNSDGTVTYTPNAGFYGTDSFDYTVSDGTATDRGTVTIDVAQASTDTALYVYDISLVQHGRKADWWQAVYEIRSDSNGNNEGDINDAPVAGVAIEVDFAGKIFTGTTDSNGIFTANWVKGLSSGTTYYANVLDLVLANYYWNPLTMDLEDDSSDDDNPARPDAELLF